MGVPIPSHAASGWQPQQHAVLMRSKNAIDFWRGVALLMIFINHVPGNVFSEYTLRNFAIVDSAELFVFLAGWSLSYATRGPTGPHPPSRVGYRLVTRAIELYSAQLVVTVLALALLAATAISRDNPLYLEWHNAGPVFYDAPRAIIGLVLLTHQLGYFNILPLYVVLLLMAPVFIIVAQRNLWLAFGLSFLIYAVALVTRISPPTWPAEEPWYFNPLSWQLVLMMGYLAAELSRDSERFCRISRQLIPLSILVLAAGAYVTVNHIWPDPFAVPEPRMVFLFNKTFLSPVRVVSLIALVIAFHRVFDYIPGVFSSITAYFCALGRNSLPVFFVGSLLSLAGQIARFTREGDFLTDSLILVIGVVTSGLTAWFVEWRRRLPDASRP